MEVELMIEECEGKPAPLPLLAVQSFANTLDVEEEIDHLDSADSFEAWLRKHGLVGDRLELRPQDLQGARRLRDTVRALLTTNNTGETDRAAAAMLGRLADRYRVALVADEDGNLAPALSAVARAEELIPQLLAVIFHAQATGTWPRLKLCQNDECLWAFYDSSKNRSGSWCRMGLCGNRIKNRAYRERQRSG
jgi:predicted RNA-binding Zn ribbon-like protein